MDYSFIDISGIPDAERPKFLQTMHKLKLSYFDSSVPLPDLNNGLPYGPSQPLQKGPVNGPQYPPKTQPRTEAPVHHNGSEKSTQGPQNRPQPVGVQQPKTQPKAPSPKNGPVNGPQRSRNQGLVRNEAGLNPDAPAFQPKGIQNLQPNTQPAQASSNAWGNQNSGGISYADRVKNNNNAASKNNTRRASTEDRCAPPQAAAQEQAVNGQQGQKRPSGDNGVTAPHVPQFTEEQYRALRATLSEFLNKRALSLNNNVPPPEPKGLKNDGQDCFVLCILQMLLQTKRFATLVREFNVALGNHSLDLLEKEAPFWANLVKLWRDYVACKGVLKDNYIINLLPYFNNEEIQKGKQCDATEFMTSFIQRLQEELRCLRENNDKPFENLFFCPEAENGQEEEKEQGWQQVRAGRRAGRRQMTSDTRCPIGNIFVGSITYWTDRSVGSKPEPFLDLALAVTDDEIGSVKDAFQAFFHEELLPGSTRRQPFLSGLPQTLILSLKNTVLEKGQFLKVGKNINIDQCLDLDIRLLCPTLREKYQKKKLLYRLSAGVFHEGGSCQRGHYWTFSRKGNGRMWNKMNDTTTSVMAEEELGSHEKERKNRLPYCLTYELCQDN